METYSGIVKEIGGVEMSADGTKEKPRKVVISDSPDYAGKTFRVWGNDSNFDLLQGLIGQHVTVEYEATPVQFGDRKWTSNDIKEVHQNGAGAGQEVAGGEATADWSVPAPTNSSPPPEVWRETKAIISGKDDYWEQRAVMDQQRSLEMEAAWAVKATLDSYTGISLSQEELVDKAISLAILKRRVASELSE